MTAFIALIDANNFYASCEQMINPYISDQPVVVLSNNDGCIISRSSEARKLGIQMGEPYFKVKMKLERLKIYVRSSNYELYGDISDRMMTILKSYFEKIEIYSIDEAFVEISPLMHNDINKFLGNLRAQMYRDIGITISIGIGLNKVQAKIATYIAKTINNTAGVFNIANVKNKDKWMETIKIEDVWGIGKSNSKWCKSKGIKNSRELRDYPSYIINSKLGILGIRIQNELKGQKCFALKDNLYNRRQISVSRSFGKTINTIQELKESIAHYITIACQKLRRQNDLAKVITIFACSSSYSKDLYTKKITKEINNPTNDTHTFIQLMMPHVEKLFRENTNFVKSGVILKKLNSATYYQKHIFEINNEKNIKRERQLTKTIDYINNKYGRNTLRWGACGVNPKWLPKNHFLSNLSTTKIHLLSIVKASD